MTDSCAKREQNPHYGLYNGLKLSRANLLRANLRHTTFC